MKKLLLLSLGLIMAVGLQAQGEETAGNKMWIGGTAGFGSSSVKDGESSSGYQFGPQFGYMLNDKMGVAINLLVNGGTNKQNNANNDEVKMSGWNIEPFFRYYFAGAGNFKFFGDALVGFGGGKTTWSADDMPEDGESKYSTFGINVRPGVQYWFNDNWSMLTTIGVLGYNSQTDNIGEEDGAGNSLEETTSDFGIAVDFSNINFSVYWHF